MHLQKQCECIYRSKHLRSRRSDTAASTTPLMTQGKLFKGAISTLKSAKLVNTTGAVSVWPAKQVVVRDQ